MTNLNNIANIRDSLNRGSGTCDIHLKNQRSKTYSFRVFTLLTLVKINIIPVHICRRWKIWIYSSPVMTKSLSGGHEVLGTWHGILESSKRRGERFSRTLTPTHFNFLRHGQDHPVQSVRHKTKWRRYRESFTNIDRLVPEIVSSNELVTEMWEVTDDIRQAIVDNSSVSSYICII